MVAALSGMDPMYEYSLNFFKSVFNGCFKVAPNGLNLQERLDNLMDTLTETVYLKICQGLMERHKLPFSFYIATSIQVQLIFPPVMVNSAPWETSKMKNGICSYEAQYIIQSRVYLRSLLLLIVQEIPATPAIFEEWLSPTVWNTVNMMQEIEIFQGTTLSLLAQPVVE